VAGHARFTAVLDACALFPIATADALISLAVAGLFSAKWTVAIEDEWQRSPKGAIRVSRAALRPGATPSSTGRSMPEGWRLLQDGCDAQWI